MIEMNVKNEEGIITFNSGGDKHLTARMIDGEPWFVANEVCKSLDVANSRASVARLNKNQKGATVVDTPGGPQTVTIINEGGLYRLVLSSRKEKAVIFGNWVTDEVLPAIRKNGVYMTDKVAADVVDDPSKMVALAEEVIRQNNELKKQRRMNHKAKLELGNAQEAIIEKNMIIVEKDKELEKANKLVTGMEKVCDYAESYIRVDGLLTFSDVAVRCEEGLSAQGLRDWMQRRGIVGKRKQNGHWTILKDHHNKDYYVVDTYDQEHPDGTTSRRRALKFTEAGAFYIVTRYKEWKARVDTAFDEKERGVYQPAFPLEEKGD